MNSDVEFVAVDMPHAERLTIHILAAVAEHQREDDFAENQGRPCGGKSQGKEARQSQLPRCPLRARAALDYKPPPARGFST
jgi:hypothetical protein